VEKTFLDYYGTSLLNFNKIFDILKGFYCPRVIQTASLPQTAVLEGGKI